MNKITFIVGPTGSGKTGKAKEITGGRSYDDCLTYRHLARPSILISIKKSVLIFEEIGYEKIGALLLMPTIEDSEFIFCTTLNNWLGIIGVLGDEFIYKCTVIQLPARGPVTSKENQ